jgi:hypothetical protein
MKAIQTLESIGMGVCVGYVLICWVADLGQVGNIHPGIRYQLLFPAGVVSTAVGFVCSLLSHRRTPIFSRVTMAACILWGVWALLPRL